jgi:hypothetical protein
VAPPGVGRPQLVTYPQSPFSGPACCCDVAYLSQAFSQPTGPGRLWIWAPVRCSFKIGATSQLLTKTNRPAHKKAGNTADSGTHQAKAHNRCRKTAHITQRRYTVGSYSVFLNRRGSRPDCCLHRPTASRRGRGAPAEMGCSSALTLSRIAQTSCKCP